MKNGDEGEGGSLLRNVLSAPGDIAENLPPIGLLAITMMLSVFLVAVATAPVPS
jgi:hypothetical protein